VAVFAHYLGNRAFMLVRQCFKTAVFHEITEIIQLVVIHGETIIITYASDFRIVAFDDFAIRKGEKMWSVSWFEFSIGGLHYCASCEQELFLFSPVRE
jgi:hypothetical protein